MNALIANLDETSARGAETAAAPITAPVADPASAAKPAAADETSTRTLYRRSVAYFLFGFGSNRNTIITDEP